MEFCEIKSFKIYINPLETGKKSVDIKDMLLTSICGK